MQFDYLPHWKNFEKKMYFLKKNPIFFSKWANNFERKKYQKFLTIFAITLFFAGHLNICLISDT